jgi:hypothetical protein
MPDREPNPRQPGAPRPPRGPDTPPSGDEPMAEARRSDAPPPAAEAPEPVEPGLPEAEGTKRIHRLRERGGGSPEPGRAGRPTEERIAESLERLAESLAAIAAAVSRSGPGRPRPGQPFARGDANRGSGYRDRDRRPPGESRQPPDYWRPRRERGPQGPGRGGRPSGR